MIFKILSLEGDLLWLRQKVKASPAPFPHRLCSRSHWIKWHQWNWFLISTFVTFVWFAAVA